ncbi:MAG: hypothetical protein AAGA23_12985 [Pseudomonadota bacterium]
MHIPPPKPRLTKTCDRCGLDFPADLTECSHCTGKSGAAFARLLVQKEREARGSRALGVGLLCGAALLLGFLLAWWL